MNHEFNAVAITGARKALTELGWYEAVMREVSAATRESFASPQVNKYHPGTTLDEVVSALEKLHGPSGPETFMRTVTAKSLEGVVAPLARVFITLMGNSPKVLFERFETLLKATSRGIAVRWVAESANAGQLTFTYATPRPRAIEHSWRGVLLHVFEFCKTQGTIEALPMTDEGRSVNFRLSWP